MKNKLNLIAKITTTVTAFLLGIAVTGGSIMLENAKAVNDFLVYRRRSSSGTEMKRETRNIINPHMTA